MNGVPRSWILRNGAPRNGAPRNGVLLNGVLRNGILRNGIQWNGDRLLLLRSIEAVQLLQAAQLQLQISASQVSDN